MDVLENHIRVTRSATTSLEITILRYSSEKINLNFCFHTSSRCLRHKFVDILFSVIGIYLLLKLRSYLIVFPAARALRNFKSFKQTSRFLLIKMISVMQHYWIQASTISQTLKTLSQLGLNALL